MLYCYFKTKHTTGSITTTFRNGKWVRQKTREFYSIYYTDNDMFRPLYKEENYCVYIH